MNRAIKLIGVFLNTLNIFSSRLSGKLAFRIFCTPFATKLKPKQQQFLDEARQHSILVNGDKIKYYSWGNGPTKVLFVHGWRSNAFRWKLYINQLDPSKYTCYALDFPAHGASEGKIWNVIIGARCIEAIHRDIGFADCIVGHSVGCFATLYAIENFISTKPKSIVLLASARRLMDFITTVKGMLGMSDAALRSMIAYGEDHLQKSVHDFTVYKCVSKVDFPVLLIHDEEDKDTTVDTSIELDKLLPNSEIWLTKGYGHKLRSKEVYKRVIGFIDSQIGQ